MLKLLLGDPNARKLKRYQPIVSDINLFEEEVSPLTDGELRGRTAAFQERLANAGWPSCLHWQDVPGTTQSSRVIDHQTEEQYPLPAS